LIGRFDSLLLVPPGAATVEVGADIRRPDYGHGYEYSTNFLNLNLSTQSGVRSVPCDERRRREKLFKRFSLLLELALRLHPLRSAREPCEIFPTSPVTIFLERKASVRIIQVEIETRNKHNIGGGA